MSTSAEEPCRGTVFCMNPGQFACSQRFWAILKPEDELVLELVLERSHSTLGE